MSKKLKKSLSWLSKIKTNRHIQIQYSISSLSSSKKRILNHCKHPRTLSFAVNNGRNPDHDADSNDNNYDNSATLSDVDRFLFENFKSLYFKDDDDDVQEINDIIIDGELLDIIIDPPFAGLRGSNRFFVDSGSVSNSIMSMSTTSSEDLGSISSSNSTSTSNDTTATNIGGVDGGNVDDDVMKFPSIPNESVVTVLSCSPNPYDDLRRSMDEMVEARLQHHSTIDWDFMEELLFCYLKLNDKKSFKFILSAFVDLVVFLRQKRQDGTSDVVSEF